jgi:hypothetical protein
MLHREFTNRAEVQALVDVSVGVSEAESVVHPLTQRLHCCPIAQPMNTFKERYESSTAAGSCVLRGPL